MKHNLPGLFRALLLIAATSGVCATHGAPVPQERILPDLVVHADRTWSKLAKPESAYGCRELFTSMLAYAEAGTNLNRIVELLAAAEAMQNREPGHRAEGNFRWYSRDAEVLDYNAVDFCMQHGALLWRFHRDALDPVTRARLRTVLERGLQGLINHRPRTTYTNIALLNASDLVLLGEALDTPAAVREGEHRLALFIKTLWEEGVHEYVSPTYYGVDLGSMLLLAALAQKPETRALAETLALYFWADIALNWHAPSQRLAGTHSRTYDYLYGYGELDQILCAVGWLPLVRGFNFSTFIPLYASRQPPADLWKLCNERYPRRVEQRWGAPPACARTHWVCRDVTLSTAWSAYPGRMDIALSADLPGARDVRMPRLVFIPDGRNDPYGKLRISDGKTHSKAFHLAPWWAGTQDQADALGVAVYRDTDFKDTTGTLESHLLFRKQLQGLWINQTRVTFGQRTNAVPPGATVFLRQGSAVIGIRVPWTRGQDGEACPIAIVDDGNPYGALRLTVTHAWLDPDTHSGRTPAGVAFWLRVGSGIEDDKAFDAFRHAFATARAETTVTDAGLDIRVAGLMQPLAVTAYAPYTAAAQTTPAPPTTTLGIDGENMGRGILERSPLIQAYLKTRRMPAPITVAPDRPTVWEAEQGCITVPFEIGGDAAAASGQYLWVPEIDGQSSGGGGGCATYRLNVTTAGRYRLSGRVLAPTPEDDSFFLAVYAENGRELLADAAWSTGIFTTWTWRDVRTSESSADGALDLPQGKVTVTLRPREAGSKIDQLRLTPQK